jgi:hypothetical protein
MDHVSMIFETRIEADKALERLEAIGVMPSQVSILATDETRGRHFTLQNSTKAEEGATAGAALGGLAGAVAAALASAGAIAIPGMNIIVSGYLISALAGLGAGAATGGVVGALIGLGFPEHEAKLYEEELRSGNILLAVKPKDAEQRKRVQEILDDAQSDDDRARRTKHTSRPDDASLYS